MKIDKTERLKELYAVANKDVASTQEVAQLAAKIIKAVQEAQKGMQAEMKDCMSMCEQMCAPFKEVETNLTALIDKTSKDASDKWYKELNNEVYKLEQVIANLEQYDDSQLEAKFALVIAEVNKRIDDIKPFVQTAEETRDLLETLEGDERLDISAIKGLDKELKGIKTTVVSQGGGTMGIQLSIDNNLRGISKYINLVAGSGVTLTPTVVGEQTNIVITATGGASLTPQTPTGDVDGVNVTFTFSSTPKVIIVDQGRTLIENGGFTLAGLVATLDVAPVTSIFAI